MIIIAGYSLTKADKRDLAVAACAEMVARARKHDGCLDAWRKVAKPPKVKFRETNAKLYRTEKAEEPF